MMNYCHRVMDNAELSASYKWFEGMHSVIRICNDFYGDLSILADNVHAYKITATAYDADPYDTSDGFCPDEESTQEFSVTVVAKSEDEAKRIFSLLCYEEGCELEDEDDIQIVELPVIPAKNSNKEASQMKKTTKASALAGAIPAEEIYNLAKNADLSGMDAFQLKEFQNAMEALKEQMRIDKEYTEDVPAPAPKAEAPKHTLKDASHVGCTTLIDTAFVPEAGEDPDDAEIIVAAADSVADDDENVVINKGFRGDPDDGMHVVVLVEYPEKQNGKNGNDDYRILKFRDVKLCNEWNVFVSENDPKYGLVKRLQEISYNNKGMLSGMTKKKAFASLMLNPVTCWTVKNPQGKVVTYFDEEAFNRYFKWVQTQKSEKEFQYATKHSAKILAEDKAASFAF